MNSRLRIIRQKKGISQTHMAKELGYKSVSGYSNIESGVRQISLEKAKKISEILDISIEELFFEEKLHSLSN